MNTQSRISNYLTGFTNYFPMWVILLSVWAYFAPGLFIPIKDYMTPLFAITMFGIGLTLEVDDFIRILKMPRMVFLGTLTQYTIMPVSAFIISRIFNFDPALTLGLILAGCVPGAMSSNVMCYLCKADVAFSVSLTTCSTMLSPIITPLLTYLLAGHFIKVDILGLFLTIIYTVVLPLGVGFMLKMKFREAIERIVVVFPAMSVIAIALICAEVVALNVDRLKFLSPKLFIAIFILNLLGLVLGFYGGKLFRFPKSRTIALSIEVGMQNAGLGVVLALKHFPKEVALPPAVFCIWCIITASMLVKAKKFLLKEGECPAD